MRSGGTGRSGDGARPRRAGAPADAEGQAEIEDGGTAPPLSATRGESADPPATGPRLTDAERRADLAASRAFWARMTRDPDKYVSRDRAMTFALWALSRPYGPRTPLADLERLAATLRTARRRSESIARRAWGARGGRSADGA